MIKTGSVASLADARAIVQRSFPTERFDPIDTDVWERQYARFQEYVEAATA
jgi:hypothetical protein